MKILKSVFMGILFVMFFVNLSFAVTTDDVPTAYKMRMPIGGLIIGNDLSLLSIDSFSSGYPKIRFNVDSDSIPEQNEWYVATAFNYNKWLNVKWDSDSTDWYTKRHYHPGDDWNETTGGDTDAGEPIYAIADGIVLQEAFNSSFGNYIIIVHKTLWGEYIISFYAHMRDSALYSKGKFVNNSWIIGYVGTTGTGYFDKKGVYHSAYHLHFEIRRQLALKIDPVTKKISFSSACGALCWPKTYEKIKKYYYNPSQFIKTYNTVGKSADGAFNQPIYEAFEKNGGYDKLGLPFNNGGSKYVHDWQGIMIQDFQHPDCPNGVCPANQKITDIKHHGDDGQTAIAYNPEKNKAFLIHDGFWGVYKIHGPWFFGAPEFEEYPIDYSGSIRQDFKFAFMVWDTTSITVYSKSGDSMFEYANNEISGRKTIGTHTFGCIVFKGCINPPDWPNDFKATSPSTNLQSSITTSENMFAKILNTVYSFFSVTNAFATTNDGVVNLSWNLPVDNNLNYTTEIYRDGELAYTETSRVNTLTDTGLVSGQEYCYQQRYVVNGELSSDFSDKQCAVAQVANSSSSSSTVTPSYYRVYDHTTSKNIQTVSPYQPINRTSSFTNRDGSVYSWLSLKDVYQALNVTWKWYDPSGNLYFTYNVKTETLQPGYYWPDYMFWSYIYLNVVQPSGQWHVDIFVDNQKVVTDYFNYSLDIQPTSDFVANFVINNGATVTTSQQISLDIWNIDIHPNDGLNTVITKCLVIEDKNSYQGVTDSRWQSDCPRTFNLSLGDGPKTLYLWFIDGAGYINNQPVQADIFLDTVGGSLVVPVIELISPKYLISKNKKGTTMFFIKASDKLELKSLSWKKNNININTKTLPPKTMSTTWKVENIPLSMGLNKIEITATNILNKTITISYQIVYDMGIF